jgi:hypothetical protein
VNEYEADIGLWNWGPEWHAIDFVQREMVPELNAARAAVILSNRVDPTVAAYARQRAFKVAQDAGRISEVVSASEDLRRSAWLQIFVEDQATAWEVSWALANLGVALATYDLVDPVYYSMDDYMALVAPWFSGFPDMEIPR